MKKVIIAGLFLTSAMFAETWTGVIGDKKCGAKHTAGTEADAKCAQTCIKGGQDAVFVVGDHVVPIANPEMIKGHEGHKVTITGKMDGDKVVVESVKM